MSTYASDHIFRRIFGRKHYTSVNRLFWVSLRAVWRSLGSSRVSESDQELLPLSRELLRTPGVQTVLLMLNSLYLQRLRLSGRNYDETTQRVNSIEMASITCLINTRLL